MKNKSLIILFFSLTFFGNAFAENLLITAKNISLDKNDNTSIFERGSCKNSKQNN